MEWFNYLKANALAGGDHGGSNWDLFFLYVLFAVRETTPASRHLSSCLAADRVGSRTLQRRHGEKTPSPFRSVIEYVHDMQDKIGAVLPIVQDHLSRVQEGQRRCYALWARSQELQLEERVLLLFTQFLTQWQDPNTVKE